MRHQLVEAINSHMLLAATKSGLSLERKLLDHPEICEAVNKTVESLAEAEEQLAKVAQSMEEHDELKRIKKEVVERIAHEREVLLQSGLLEHLHEKSDEATAARVFLAEHAHHFTMHTYQHEIYRTIMMRDILIDAVRTEFFGRTA